MVGWPLAAVRLLLSARSAATTAPTAARGEIILGGYGQGGVTRADSRANRSKPGKPQHQEKTLNQVRIKGVETFDVRVQKWLDDYQSRGRLQPAPADL